MKRIFVLISALFLTIACDEESGTDVKTTPVNQALITSWADDHIIPNYKAFLSEVEKLKTAKDNFIAAPDVALLQELRQALTSSYFAFQPTATYDIGKAMEVNYYLNLNAHPLNVEKTLDNITNSQSVTLNSVLQQDAQGLPAIDYLVNGLAATDSEIVAFYTGAEAVNYQSYLTMLIDRIINITTKVIEDWETNFRQTFITNTDSSRNGSVDQFINTYIQYLERRLRSSKIGTPAGFFTLPNTFPNQIESLYNPDLSRDLAVRALEDVELLYLGVSGASSSISKELISLGASELDTLIKNQFIEAKAILSNLDSNLKSQIETDNLRMLAARDALQNIVRSMKVDMVSILGVDVIFQDNDGD